MSSLLSPINIPLGRQELMGSLGAEKPPGTPGRHRAGLGRGEERRTETEAYEERFEVRM